ncbi:hypothetical protein [Archangium sp.]|uniref:hypothetical protein n=1 Tax=Archangium sp. TaxID=1872627 RepID=UPI00286CD125|nr:hypothetical protein [Archangium sp.]
MNEVPASMAAGAVPAVPSLVEVDGRHFSVHVGGPDASLEVATSSGEQVRLRRWHFDEHLRALDRHAWADERGLRFDHEGFSRELLRDSGIPEPLHAELAPVALWWATGGAQEPVFGPGVDGWIRLGTVRARLRPWSFSERSKALSEHLTSRPGGGRELVLEHYLRAMLAASVLTLEPAGVELSTLDGATTALLLDAVVALNTAGARDEDTRMRSSDEGRALAQVTLRLCRALGWTPSQVWATPAAEVDRLLAMLELMESPAQVPAPVPRAPSLADHPDAVVIQVEDG